MISKTLKQLVIQEAKNLKKYADKKELRRLNFNDLDPNRRNLCVYGQMTGSCTSHRTTELIAKCATKTYNVTGNLNSFEKLKLNGAPDPEKRYAGSYWNAGFFSPIEVFVYRNIKTPEKNKPLVDFLKGETKTLKL